MLTERRLRQPDTLGEFADAEFVAQEGTEQREALGIGHGRQQFGSVIGPVFEIGDLHVDKLEHTNIYVKLEHTNMYDDERKRGKNG